MLRLSMSETESFTGNTPIWYRPSHAAKLLGVSRATLWRWIKKGTLPARKTDGGHYRIHCDEITKRLAPPAVAPTEEG